MGMEGTNQGPQQSKKTLRERIEKFAKIAGVAASLASTNPGIASDAKGKMTPNETVAGEFKAGEFQYSSFRPSTNMEDHRNLAAADELKSIMGIADPEETKRLAEIDARRTKQGPGPYDREIAAVAKRIHQEKVAAKIAEDAKKTREYAAYKKNIDDKIKKEALTGKQTNVGAPER